MSVVLMLAGSKEYLRVPVAVEVAGVVQNPTSDAVQIAIRAWGETTALSWQTAAWETDTTTDPDTYYARVLIGAAPFALAAGLYQVYVKITDSPEVPLLADSALYIRAA